MSRKKWIFYLWKLILVRASSKVAWFFISKWILDDQRTIRLWYNFFLIIQHNSPIDGNEGLLIFSCSSFWLLCRWLVLYNPFHSTTSSLTDFKFLFVCFAYVYIIDIFKEWFFFIAQENNSFMFGWRYIKCVKIEKINILSALL